MVNVTAPVMTKDLIAQHNLTDDEYKKIIEILGREPNITELGMFSVMWSEHCSYKSSRVHLRLRVQEDHRDTREGAEYHRVGHVFGDVVGALLL